MTKIQHKRSSVLISGAAKAPTSAQLDYGELAINYSSTDPQFFIKDSSGSVISILSSYAPLDGATFTGDVNFDAEAIIKGDSTNSGALTLNSETNTKYVKIQAPANSSLTSYTLTLPNDDGGSGEVLSTDGSGGLSWAYAAMSTADKTKLDGIAAGAEVNVNADWTASSGDAEILNKPTNVSAFTNDAGYITGAYGNFISSNADDSFSGKLTGSGSAGDWIKYDGSSTGPYLQMKTSGTSNGYLQFTTTDAYFRNDRTGRHIRIGSNLVYNDSSADRTVWHAGNDGAGSGLDADNLDGYTWTSGTNAKFSRLEFTGVGGNSDNGLHNYAIYQEGGAWSSPYPDLVIGYHTGIKIGGYYSYNGTRFYNDAPGRSGATEIFSVGNGDNNVRVTNNLYVGGNIAWHAGNDGSGSGLDADNLDGKTWGSSGKDVRATEFYADNWFRNYNSGEGLYNQATGAHWYSDGDGIWNLAGNTQNQSTSLKFRGAHNGNIEGWIHANGSGWLGVLNTGGQWQLKQYNIDGYSPNLWFDEESNETWTGNPGSDEGKIEYHSNRFYIAAGSNSTEVVRFRRSGSDVAHINNSGNFYSPIMYDNNNTGYYIDPASNSNLNTARFQGNACYIRGGSPTLYFQDTNNRSCMLHNNSNLLYVLRGSGNDSISWTQTGSQWPFIWYLENNNAKCGGSFEAVGNITAYSSDRRLKQNFKPIESALDKVNELNGLYFDWKTEVIDLGFTPDQMTDDIGLIAQDVQAVLPQAVKPAPFDQTWDNDLNKNVSTSGEDYITVQYERLVPLLVEAIKELSVRLTSLENKL